MRAMAFEDWIVAGALLYRSNEFQSIFDKPRISCARFRQRLVAVVGGEPMRQAQPDS
jgi:hypothetical protein